jgi:hypothetical protein
MIKQNQISNLEEDLQRVALELLVQVLQEFCDNLDTNLEYQEPNEN